MGFLLQMEEKVKSHCNSCGQETNQRILFTHSIKANEDHGDFHFYEEKHYMVIQCMGCEEVSYLTKYLLDDSDTVDDDSSFYINYPEGEYGNDDFEILTPEKYEQFPSMIRNLYEEVDSALQKEAFLLAGLGLRTLVEAICIEQNITGRDLQTKIKNLQLQGLISASELPILDKLRLIGNFSAHKIKRFPSTQLGYALSIINHILVSIYILPKISKKLKI